MTEKLTPKDIDLAASPGHHHIAGTSYHWKHGWHPIDVATAARYHKAFKGLTTFHHVEPEEFNGYDSMPKFVGEAHPSLFVDNKPQMKYSKNKILADHFVTHQGKTYKVDSVSASKTHVKLTDGAGNTHKAKITDIEGVSKDDKAAFLAFQKHKFKPAEKTFQIKHAAKPYKPKPFVSKNPTSPFAPKIKTPEGYKPSEDFPALTSSSSLSALNVHTPLHPKEHSSVRSYTGSAYQEINGRLRRGKLEGSAAKTDVERIDGAFTKATKVPGNPMLHRGTNVAALTALQPGDEFTEPGYSSTSRDPKRAFGGSAALHIQLRDAKALDVKPISLHPAENEVLLHRNTKFKVRKRFVGPNGRVHLFVDAYQGEAQ